ncbi:GTP 3',8-cyclase MoaA [Roseivirga sp. UBA838]|uniref:GTP 3',8-cyclase MoaA n=1 Tax=Roseivirga sp. UBA838 TaxID=1947393 RepID=UPI00257A2BD1|nr:GTP 3',8-cyclase MoaA [Roseivirga sp. UBA838]
MLVDNHGRPLRYLRLGVTERCNLRCFYCMPEEGLAWSSKNQLLSYEEMLRLVAILAGLGIDKVRLTGGEPFVRKDLVYFMRELKAIKGIKQLSITTNGTAPVETIAQMKALGIHAVNLSLDSLNPERFARITRRNEFDKVWSYFEELMNQGLRTKINAVVMEEHNLEDILPMVALTEKHSVSVRFIEEMPFNGGSKGYQKIKWNYEKILHHILNKHPQALRLDDHSSSTSYNYKVPGYAGSFGVIPAYSRAICATCDRIRITPKGELKTCLYQNGGFSFRDYMRAGATDKDLQAKFREHFGRRAKNGFEAEQNKEQSASFESMATIGG